MHLFVYIFDCPLLFRADFVCVCDVCWCAVNSFLRLRGLSGVERGQCTICGWFLGVGRGWKPA